MLEKDFQSDIVGLAKQAGWKAYHTYDSRKSAAGFPDLVLIQAPLLIAAELKLDDNKPTAEQREWLEAFDSVREVLAYVWRPKDWNEIVGLLGGG